MAHLPIPSPLTDADYGAIEGAVMETTRGRWFLAEFARRNRHADTTMLLKALDRIEGAMRGERSVESVDRIRFDLVDMAKAISRTKAEIAAIKPDADHHGKFGEASEELDSVVQATEAATSDILACAERIQEMAWTLREQGLENEVCDLLDAKATEVYTACSFQDLTGQRTRKVIQVLRYLEDRINAMVGIWGLDGAMLAETSTVESEQALLNGPARPGEGLDQADIDMVMGPSMVGVNAPHQHSERESLELAPPLQPTDASVESPAAENVAPEMAEPMPVEEMRVSPRASDPLAPLMALSAEEKIALFT
jgi:chemotaxis regulatin CheY-phosphate phosphatase CheZ